MQTLEQLRESVRTLEPSMDFILGDAKHPMVGKVLRIEFFQNNYLDFSLVSGQLSAMNWGPRGDSFERSSVFFLGDFSETDLDVVAEKIVFYSQALSLSAKSLDAQSVDSGSDNMSLANLSSDTLAGRVVGWAGALAVGCLLVFLSSLGQTSPSPQVLIEPRSQTPSQITPEPLSPVFPSEVTGGGYTVICNDGWVSNSGGKQGACSHHGGVRD